MKACLFGIRYWIQSEAIKFKSTRKLLQKEVGFYFVNKIKLFLIETKECFNKKTQEKKRPIHSKCVSSKMSIIATSSKFYDKKEFSNSIEICITIASCKTNSC
jgi:hypothetical protein